MQKVGLFLILILCVSCNFFESTQKKTHQLVEQEMKVINWNTVDQYPLFDVCDELAEKTQQKTCFENTFLKHYTTILADFEYKINGKITDTLNLDFIIDSKGIISLYKVDKNAAIADQIPEFKAIIARGLKSLPNVKPALKRGIPIKAKFRLPIIINSK